VPLLVLVGAALGPYEDEIVFLEISFVVLSYKDVGTLALLQRIIDVRNQIVSKNSNNSS
jgi:hypothetical protein